MKTKTLALAQISLLLWAFVTTQKASVAAEKPSAQQGGGEASATIPEWARFDLKDIDDDRYGLVGRLSIRRQFLGTRATPPFQDLIQFHGFDGEELKFSTFTDPELERSLLKQLAGGRSLPVKMTVRFENVRVGHDGINVSERLVAHIEGCEPKTAEAVATAAEAAGFDEEETARFKEALHPDVEKDGIAISLGKVSARSNATPRATALAIHGIRVFNTTSEAASIEITGLTIEQEGEVRQCELSKRSRAPLSWEVEANTWSDGSYEAGKMPGTLWMYDPPGPIGPKKKVTVRLELKLNGGEPMILTRTINPI